jgi:hypothetical protein
LESSDSAARVHRIVVVGPSDVEGHFSVVRRVAEGLNHQFEPLHLLFQVVDWHSDAHPAPHAAGGQGQVASDLRIEESDILIAIFWKLFGTSVKGGQSATAGEVMSAYAAWEAKQRPRVMVYFDQQPHKPRTIWESDQERSVLAFRDELKSKLLYTEFNGELEFERKIQADLLSYLVRQVKAEASVSPTSTVQTLSCSASSTPYLVRHNGITELVGDLILSFLGQDPPSNVAMLELVKIALALNTTVCNRISLPDMTDATMVIERPGSASYLRGKLTAANFVEFAPTLAEVVDATTIRVSNIRANASALIAGREPLTAITAVVVINDIPLDIQQTLAYLDLGFGFDLTFKMKIAALRQLSVAGSINGLRITTVRFRELFPCALKTRAPNSHVSRSTVVGTGRDCEVLICESGHQNKVFTNQDGSLAISGLADFGTAVSVEFDLIPQGAQIWVSIRQTASSAGLEARLVYSESGLGAYPDASTELDGTQVAEVSLTGGTGRAVWEIANRTSLEAGYVEFGIFLSSQSPADLNMLATARITGLMGPSSSVFIASGTTVPVPRFVSANPSLELFSVSS